MLASPVVDPLRIGPNTQWAEERTDLLSWTSLSGGAGRKGKVQHEKSVK